MKDWRWSESIPGWFDWQDLYDEVAYTTPPHSVIVEVGVAFGLSLLYLSQKIKEIGRPGIQICAVDRWLPHQELAFAFDPDRPAQIGEARAWDAIQKHKGDFFAAFMYYLHDSGMDDIVRVLRLDSLSAARVFKGLDQPPHFVFIDAAHDAESVKQDIDAWWDLKPEWMAGHDYNRGSERDFPGVWKTVDAKFGQENVEWRGQTCFVVRRAHLERPR